MPAAVRAITLRGRLYAANCYLVKGDAGFVLIDTGLATRRADLEASARSCGLPAG